jgi:hypothetical protein
MSEPIHPEVVSATYICKSLTFNVQQTSTMMFWASTSPCTVQTKPVLMRLGCRPGGYHHYIAVNTFHSAGGTPPPQGHTGLYHFAILYPNRRELAKAVKRVLEHGHTFTGTQDSGPSESVFLRDPDGNGLELYYDRLASNGPTSRASRSLLCPGRLIWKTCVES